MTVNRPSASQYSHALSSYDRLNSVNAKHDFIAAFSKGITQT